MILALALVAIANLSILTTAFPDANCADYIEELKLLIALDCSGSIDGSSWARTIDFAKQFATEFTESQTKAEVAVEFFSDKDILVQDFTRDLKKILLALDSAPKCGGGTYFPAGTQALFDRFESAALKILLLVTDGRVNKIELAGPLKRSGVTIFTVGIGDVTADSLKSICSRPAAEFNHLMPGHRELPFFVGELVKKVSSSVIRYWPSYGPVTGGVIVAVHIPWDCLWGVDTISCAWGSTEVPRLIVSLEPSSVIHCVSPVTNERGSQPFSVILRKGSRELKLTALQRFQLDDPYPAKPEVYDLFIDHVENIVIVQWEKFSTDPITLVDLFLQRIRYKYHRAQPQVAQEYLLAKDVKVKSSKKMQVWKGYPIDKIPSEFRGIEFLQVRQAKSTIETIPTPFPSEGVPYWTAFRQRGVNRIDCAASPISTKK